MPLSLAVLTAAPEDVQFGDAGTFKVGPLSFAALGRVQRVIDRLARSPLDAIKPHLEGLPPEERAPLVRDATAAMRRWAIPQVGTAKGWRVLFDSAEGRAGFFRIAMEESNPTLDGATIDALYRRLTPEAFIAVRDIALGAKDDDGPKAGVPAEELEARARLAELEARLAEELAAATSDFSWISAPSGTA